MSKLNNDQLKIYNSPAYRRRIKRMVELAKTVRGIHGKVPRGGLPRLKGNASEKDKKARSAAEALRLNLASIQYFAAPITSYSGGGGQSQSTSTPAPEAPATE